MRTAQRTRAGVRRRPLTALGATAAKRPMIAPAAIGHRSPTCAPGMASIPLPPATRAAGEGGLGVSPAGCPTSTALTEGDTCKSKGRAASTSPAPAAGAAAHARHEATKQEILDAAWQMVRADGLNALSLRALANT